MTRALPAAVFLAALLVSPGSARAQDLTPLALATIPIDAGAEVFYAQSQGFFHDAGLDPHIQSIGNGAAITAAVVSGAVDIGYSNIASLAIAYKRGLPVTIIAPAGLYRSNEPTSVCVVAPASPIRSAKDLNGKTFATNGLKNVTEFAPRAWIDANGGDASTMKFIELTFNEMPAALAAGRVDAALMAEPSVTEFKNQVRVLGKCYDAIATTFVIAAYFTTTPWALAHPDLVRRFQAALRRTAAWSNHHRAATAAFLAAQMKLDPAVANAMVRSTYPETLNAADLQPMIDITAKYGGIPATFSAAELVFKPPSR